MDGWGVMQQGWSRARAQLVQGATGWMFVFTLVFERCCFVVEPTGEERRGGRGWVVGFGEGLHHEGGLYGSGRSPARAAKRR